ncbi:hypothetical protein K1X84_13445 [bacterium]|nr:hypothetical protein [bacterium]
MKVIIVLCLTSYFWLISCDENKSEDILPPTEVQASDGTFADRIKISWVPLQSVQSYDIFRSDTTISEYQKIGTTDETDFDDSSATTVFKIYSYKIRARNGSKVSDFSDEDIGYRDSIEIGLTDRPANVAASDSEFVDKIRITWTGSPIAQFYEVFRFNPVKQEYDPIGSTMNLVYDDSTIGDPLTAYFYKVRCRNGVRVSELSDSDMGYLRRLIAPSIISATDGSDEDKITISWNSVKGVSSYEIYRSGSMDGSYSLITITTDTLYNDGTATAITDYFYKVRSRFGAASLFSPYSPIDSGYRLQKYTYVTQWGTAGISDGQFIGPFGVATDRSGNIYVSDWNNNRIQVFTSNGSFLRSMTPGLNYPRGIVFDKNGHLYIADSGNSRIIKCDSLGNILLTFGSFGTGNGQFNAALRDLAVDDSYLYVVDHNNDRIQKFDFDGNFITKWGNNGSGIGQFVYPWGIVVLNDGTVMVSEDNKRVQVFTNTGGFIRSFIPIDLKYYLSEDNAGYIYSGSGDRVVKMNSYGKVVAKILLPGGSLASGVIIDAVGNVFVAAFSTNIVYKYAPLE